MNTPTTPRAKTITLLFLLPVLTGCETMLQNEKPPAAPSGIIEIKVEPPPAKGAPVLVSGTLADDPQHPVKLATHRAGQDGMASFVAPLGSLCNFRAFADLDGDGKPGLGDPAASISGIKPVAPADTSPGAAVNLIRLPAAALPRSAPTLPAPPSGS